MKWIDNDKFSIHFSDFPFTEPLTAIHLSREFSGSIVIDCSASKRTNVVSVLTQGFPQISLYFKEYNFRDPFSLGVSVLSEIRTKINYGNQMDSTGNSA